ncbi:trypsin-like serine protease [Vibrio sp. RC27]
MKRQLTTLLSTFSCLPAVMAMDLSTYIVNGDETSLTSYPNFASLFWDSVEYDGTYRSASFCGATVLSDTFVLTAAHCIFDDEDIDQEYMLFTAVGQTDDMSNWLDTVDTVRASKFYYFTSFDNSGSDLWANDIAIIELESSLNSAGIVTMPADESYRDEENSTYVTIGLGKTDDDDLTSDNTLLSANMNYIDNDGCKSSLASDYGTNYSDRFTDKQICFEGSDKDTTTNNLVAGICSGDSGGPIYHVSGSTYTQVGITSFGPSRCGSKDVTSYYTELADYIGWIEGVMAGTYDSSVTSVYVATEAKREAFVNGEPLDDVSAIDDSSDTSDENTSDDGASSDDTSGDNTSDDGASSDDTSDDSTSDDGASSDDTSDDDTSDDGASNDETSDDNTSDDEASGDNTSDDNTSDDNASDEDTSESTSDEDPADEDFTGDESLDNDIVAASASGAAAGAIHEVGLLLMALVAVIRRVRMRSVR